MRDIAAAPEWLESSAAGAERFPPSRPPAPDDRHAG
ncbi:hypothetical protein EDD30_0453 [Couchioplanes caeruleus]|uniref:Uncharacterized protein n=1 Tax=Couchioplanes caeruleus TaxID=56438 RepID=A0A3N1GCA0_9ACTN|nr:hypothetical protein EDD30_0453 [Couchioplanes caeruleus]